MEHSFNTNVIIPVVGFFKGVWTSVSGFFSSLWEDIKGVWNSVATWFNNTIIEPVTTAFEKACEAIRLQTALITNQILKNNRDKHILILFRDGGNFPLIIVGNALCNRKSQTTSSAIIS